MHCENEDRGHARHRVLEHMHRSVWVTYQDLEELTGLATPTLRNHVSRLFQEGYIEKRQAQWSRSEKEFRPVFGASQVWEAEESCLQRRILKIAFPYMIWEYVHRPEELRTDSVRRWRRSFWEYTLHTDPEQT